MSSTSVPNTAIYQREHAVTQRIHGGLVDTRRGKEKYGNPLSVRLHSRAVGLIVLPSTELRRDIGMARRMELR
jgi:hypothetical protein